MRTPLSVDANDEKRSLDNGGMDPLMIIVLSCACEHTDASASSASMS